MQIHELKRITPNRKSKNIGRGGKRGKTSGRGGKGQTARAGSKIRPEIRDMIKAIPKLRGRGVNSNKSVYEKPFVINLSSLNTVFADNEKVNPASLVKHGLLSLHKGKKPFVKILGTGEITKKLIITDCTISKSAQEKIEKAGGKVLTQ